MAYERVVPVRGRTYSDDVIESGALLYESVDALVLDIQENPEAYDIMESREIAGIYFHRHWALKWKGSKQKVHFFSCCAPTELVIFTVCNERPDEDDIPEDYPSCGMYDPEGKWWCGWHEDFSTSWKSKTLVTVRK